MAALCWQVTGWIFPTFKTEHKDSLFFLLVVYITSLNRGCRRTSSWWWNSTHPASLHKNELLGEINELLEDTARTETVLLGEYERKWVTYIRAIVEGLATKIAIKSYNKSYTGLHNIIPKILSSSQITT